MNFGISASRTPSRAPLAWTHDVDDWHVHVNEDWEIHFWTRALDCTEDQLRSAVRAVGNGAANVRAYLNS